MKKNFGCLALRMKNSFTVYQGFAVLEIRWFTKKTKLDEGEIDKAQDEAENAQRILVAAHNHFSDQLG